MIDGPELTTASHTPARNRLGIERSLARIESCRAQAIQFAADGPCASCRSWGSPERMPRNERGGVGKGRWVPPVSALRPVHEEERRNFLRRELGAVIVSEGNGRASLAVVDFAEAVKTGYMSSP